MGEADRYYNPGQPQNGQGYGYGQQYSQPPPPPPPPQQAYGGYGQQPAYNNGGYQQDYNAGYQQNQQPDEYPLQQPPPEYSYAPAQPVGDEKYSFDQAFKVDKPKYNDLWAGLLVSRHVYHHNHNRD